YRLRGRGHPRRLRRAALGVGGAAQPRAGAGRAQAPAQGAVVGRRFVGRPLRGRPARARAGPLRRPAAGRPPPGGAPSAGPHVTRAYGEAGRPQRRGRAAGLLHERATPGRGSGGGAEDPDDQRGELDGGGGGDALRPEVADRAVLQRVQGDARAAPLPLPAVHEGGELGAGLPGCFLLPGVVTGGPSGAARPGGGAEALVAGAALSWAEPGGQPGGRGARPGEVVPAVGDGERAASAPTLAARGAPAGGPPHPIKTWTNPCPPPLPATLPN